MESFYLGPLGRLMRFPAPPAGYDADPVEYGASQTGLSGRVTKDVFGNRRTIKIELGGAAPRVLSWLEMIYMGAVAGPMYLLDTRRANRLSRRVSSTLSYPFPVPATGPTHVDASGVAIATTTAVAAAVTLLPNGTTLSQGPTNSCQWVPVAAGVLRDALLTPVLAGERLVFSCYTQAGSPTLEIQPLSSTGAVVGSPATGTTTIAGTPNRLWVSYTVPAGGTVAAVVPQLRAGAAGTYTTVAWQLESAVTGGPTDWVFGTGCPQVIVDDQTQHREAVGVYTTPSLTLLEV